MVVGKKFLEKGLIEVQIRKNGQTTEISPGSVTGFVKDFLSENKAG